MIRRGLKAAVATALARTGGHRLVGRLAGPPSPVLVLGYHRVVEDFEAAARHTIPAMLISRAMLERQLAWVGRTHRFVTLDTAAEALRGDAPGPSRPFAAVTFDDGYADVHDVALPLLRRMGVPATVFVVTDLAGSSSAPAHDVLYALLSRALASPDRSPRGLLAHVSRRMGFPSVEAARALLSGNAYAATRAALATMPLGRIARLARLLEEDGPADLGPVPPRPLTWEMIAGLRASGIGIGSHTRSHPYLTAETPARVAEEVGGSRDLLQRRLHAPIRHFAYPDGRFTRGIVDAVASAGYAHAWTVCSHRDAARPELTLPRRLLWEKSCLDGSGRFSGDVMTCCAAGVFDLLSACRVPHAGAEAS